MSFFKKLFGQSVILKKDVMLHSYEGFEIAPAPQKDGDNYRLAGFVSKEIEGQRMEHFLIRADIFSSLEEAEKATLIKAQRLIDEQGEKIFR